MLWRLGSLTDAEATANLLEGQVRGSVARWQSSEFETAHVCMGQINAVPDSSPRSALCCGCTPVMGISSAANMCLI